MLSDLEIYRAASIKENTYMTKSTNSGYADHRHTFWLTPADKARLDALHRTAPKAPFSALFKWSRPPEVSPLRV